MVNIRAACHVLPGISLWSRGYNPKHLSIDAVLARGCRIGGF